MPVSTLWLTELSVRSTGPELTDFMLENLSDKHTLVCLKYEIGVNKATGEIFWIRSLPGAVHDINVLRDNGLLDLLDRGERILGDKG